MRLRLSLGNGPRIQQLRSDLHRCVQAGQSVVTYFGRLFKIWDELSLYVATRGCTCGLCTCNWAASPSQEREDKKVHQFLVGLDISLFGTIRSNIIAQEPLPPLNRDYALLIQEDRQRAISTSQDQQPDVGAFAAQRNSQAPPPSSNSSRSSDSRCDSRRRRGD